MSVHLLWCSRIWYTGVGGPSPVELRAESRALYVTDDPQGPSRVTLAAEPFAGLGSHRSGVRVPTSSRFRGSMGVMQVARSSPVRPPAMQHGMGSVEEPMCRRRIASASASVASKQDLNLVCGPPRFKILHCEAPCASDPLFVSGVGTLLNDNSPSRPLTSLSCSTPFSGIVGGHCKDRDDSLASYLSL